jgi:hypothetical protein
MMKDYALITGASGGIGYYFAHELAKRRHNLILIARSEDKLQKLANELKEKYSISCNYLPLDLSQPGASTQITSWCKGNQYQINILINNAGYGLFGSFENQSIEQVTNMMQLNMNTLVELCHVFIPQLKSKSKAYILNVASTASYQAVPTLASYAASKAFVVLFTRGLRYELKDTNLSVSCLSPGTTSTNFMDRAGMESLKERAEKFAMSAEVVAKIGIEGMFKGKAEIIPGFVNWFSATLAGFVPKALTERIAASLYE